MTRAGSPVAVGVAGAVVALLTLVVWLTRPAPLVPATTHGGGEAGLRTLYLLAGELGLRVERWERPFFPPPRVLAMPSVLVVAAPALSLRPTEAAWLLDWVYDGGRLLYVAGDDDDELLDRLGVAKRMSPRSEDEDRIAEQEITVCAPPDPSLSDDARALVEGTAPYAVLDWYALADVAGPRMPREVLLRDGRGDLVAARLPHGAGELLLLSDVDGLTNAKLADAGAMLLVARMLAYVARGEPLYFDEYHHGFDARQSLPRATAGFLARTDLGWGIVQMMLVLAGALAAAGVRLGSPLEPATARRRSSLEHVDALAAAYRGAGARRRAAHLLREGLRLRVRLPSAAALDDWLDALARARPALAAAAATVRAPTALTDDQALVGFARAVDAVLQEDRHAFRS